MNEYEQITKVQNDIEKILNDFESGETTKDETIVLLREYVYDRAKSAIESFKKKRADNLKKNAPTNLPWEEKLNVLQIDPRQATLEDISKMATELSNRVDTIILERIKANDIGIRCAGCYFDSEDHKCCAILLKTENEDLVKCVDGDKYYIYKPKPATAPL